MSKKAVNDMQRQIENTVAGPARTFATLMLDHIEKLTSLQFESARTYADTGLRQARAALEVKEPSDLQSYVEKQQKVANELSERFKEDVEKVMSLNQAFASKAQKVAQESSKEASQAMEEEARKAAQAVEKESKKQTQAAAKGK